MRSRDSREHAEIHETNRFERIFFLRTVVCVVVPTKVQPLIWRKETFDCIASTTLRILTGLCLRFVSFGFAVHGLEGGCCPWLTTLSLPVLLLYSQRGRYRNDVESDVDADLRTTFESKSTWKTTQKLTSVSNRHFIYVILSHYGCRYGTPRQCSGKIRGCTHA